MANSTFQQFFWSKIKMLSMIEGQMVIGASGAVSSYTGNGVLEVLQLTTGIYSIQLQENFNAFLGANFTIESPVTGGSVSDGSFVADTLYQITSAGDTDWSAIGFPDGFTPAAGTVFLASSSGGSGTGTAKAIGASGISSIEVAQNAQAMIASSNINEGALFYIQTLDDAGSLADPAAGSIIEFSVMLRNSSVAM